MNMTLTAEQEALRSELRGYFAELMTDELKQELEGEFKGEGGGTHWRAALKKLGKDGWIGLGWPEKFGGQAKGPIEQYIFFSECRIAGFPFNFLTSESVGPAIAEFGSEDLQDEVIPKILRGEINIAIGYSEPSAGTDLAALTTKAVPDGDDYVINGQKMWTSLIEFSDYIWLACRTGDVDKLGKHGSLSMFLISMDTPGISFTPVYTLGGVRTNATYFENVRVHKSRLVGEENAGWRLITSQLNRERLALGTHGTATGLFKRVCEYAATTTLANGERLIDQDWVRLNLAKARQAISALCLICYRQAWTLAETGNLDLADASVAKVYGSESMIEATRAMMEVVGQHSLLPVGSARSVLEGELEKCYRACSISTFGGGTNEIQRDLISVFGLGMPRPIRA